MPRYLLKIQYDGTGYNGWQRQAKGETVQGCIENALSTLLQTPVEIYGAGRTDSGVHAEDQAAHFDYTGSFTEKKYLRRLNRFLPDNIAVQSIAQVPDEFHARFDAEYRQYRYQIIFRSMPLHRHYSWYLDPAPDPGKIHRCLSVIHGIHDFGNFARKTPGLKHTRCEILKTELVRIGDDEIHIRIQANRFLRNMVRMLTGAMVQVASDKLEFSEFERMLKEPGYPKRIKAAPAKGLILEKVFYP